MKMHVKRRNCEMCKCNECEISFLHLVELGIHMKNEHGNDGSISHFKRQLINHDFFDETFYFASELYSDKNKKIRLITMRSKPGYVVFVLLLLLLLLMLLLWFLLL